ncbi:MAG TPA: hypothetical protein VF611_15820 [Pyrinomonadaceae bacterium]|jgi:hypothetical protein
MSIGINIPQKPGSLPDDASETDIINHNDAMQKYWFAVQQAANEQSMEADAMSNVAKAGHDAMMAIANNMK